MDLDAIVFGGGVAGLWTLEDLTRRNYSAVLVENNMLGYGQTIVSQGIIHGGFKYVLPGENRKDSARELSDIPTIWRDSLLGKKHPNLSGDILKSDYIYLWTPSSTKKIKSFMDSAIIRLGSKILNTTPKKLNKEQVPAWFAQSASEIYELREPVVDSSKLLYNLAKPNNERIIYTEKIIAPPEIDKTEKKYKWHLKNRFDGRNLEINANTVILAAGSGNSELLKALGINEELQQEKNIRHLFVKGNIPEFYGHCIERGRTEITITTHRDLSGNYVWNIGAGSGGIGDKGVAMGGKDFITYGKKEIARILPGVNISETEWGTFGAVKVESITEGRKRPAGPIVKKINNIVFGWPTKLAFAPIFSSAVLGSMPEPAGLEQVTLDTYAEPQIAKAPWERDYC